MEKRHCITAQLNLISLECTGLLEHRCVYVFTNTVDAADTIVLCHARITFTTFSICIVVVIIQIRDAACAYRFQHC